MLKQRQPEELAEDPILKVVVEWIMRAIEMNADRMYFMQEGEGVKISIVKRPHPQQVTGVDESCEGVVNVRLYGVFAYLYLFSAYAERNKKDGLFGTMFGIMSGMGIEVNFGHAKTPKKIECLTRITKIAQHAYNEMRG